MHREYVEIAGCKSIDELIARLAAAKRDMPPGSGQEQVQLRGDDNFGRHILVTYLRPERPDELELRNRSASIATM